MRWSVRPQQLLQLMKWKSFAETSQMRSTFAKENRQVILLTYFDFYNYILFKSISRFEYWGWALESTPSKVRLDTAFLSPDLITHWTDLTTPFRRKDSFNIPVRLFARLLFSNDSLLIQSDWSACVDDKRVEGSTSNRCMMRAVASLLIPDQYFGLKPYFPRRIIWKSSFWSSWWNG